MKTILLFVLSSFILVQGWGLVPSNTTQNLNYVSNQNGLLILGDSGTILADSSPAPKANISAQSSVNFRPQLSGTTHNLYSMYCINTCYVVGDSGTILHQVNNSWVPLSSGTNKALHSVFFYEDLDSGYAVGDSGIIIQMNGNSWDRLNSGATQNLYSILFQLNYLGGSPTNIYDTGFAVGAGGTILKTTDKGMTWKKETSGTNQTLYSVYFGSNSPIGYAVGAGGTILKSFNEGVTWTIVASGTTNDLYGSFFPNNLIVGQGGIILSTSDTGKTWDPINSGTTQNLYSVYDGVAVGASGTIVESNVTSPITNQTKFQDPFLQNQYYDLLGRHIPASAIPKREFLSIPILFSKP